jgi:ATP/maltotriose-dependent transcriptional regulator MalT
MGSEAMTTESQTARDSLAAGADALRRGAWNEARERFEAAVAADESAEALEGLGWAGWWLHDAGLTIGARERAYRAFRAAGDPAGAGRVAAWLASDFLEFRGEDAVARGWLERSHRMLDDLPESEERGWLALNEGSYLVNVIGDLEEAARLAARAAGLGRELGVSDLEAVGLALEGITLVRRGSVQEGMRLLDEASAIAAAEELRLPLARGWALCYLISACEGVGDFPRATQWCSAARVIAERWDARQMLGVCRSAYGNVLATNGDWAAAEVELTGAVADLLAARPAMAAGGLARLGELRARQGRDDDARALFERAGAHPRAVVGLGLLALDSADPAAAADAAERVLRRLSPAAMLDRVPALELLVRARIELRELEAAEESCAELERAGDAIGTPYVRGRARLAAARMFAARGAHDDARRACEDAVDLLVESGAAYETALARLELARALRELGRSEAATAEAGIAREAFAALGAERDVARAEAVARPKASASEFDRPLGDLTSRELEVLRLVAQGLSDAEIAERLVLSQHTVHRHMANIRLKLRLPSRAAAVAYAARAGLL